MISKNKNKILSIIFISLYSLVLVAVPIFARAATFDIPCTPSTTPITEPATGTSHNTDLFDCVNQLYKYALIISSITAVFMIIIAGYMYIFSGGNTGKVSTAKSFITTSLLGIAMLLVGFLLLKQINPELLSIKNITPDQIGQIDWAIIGHEDGATNPVGVVPSGPVITDCPGGQLVDIPQGEFTQYDTNKTCPNVLEALRKLKQIATSAGAQFKVNDSYGQGHASKCHTQSGTCVDIGLLGSTTWDQLCSTVKTSGVFRILNESGSTTPNCGTYVKTSKATGPHLHLNLLK